MVTSCTDLPPPVIKATLAVMMDNNYQDVLRDVRCTL